MKRTLFVLAISCACIHLAAQELVPVFGPIISVTPTNSTGSTRPRIALANDSVPIVTWTKVVANVGTVYAAKWNGTGFDPAVQISRPGMNIYCSTGEGGDIAARGDTVFIVFFTTISQCYAVRSIDGGATWGDTVRVDHVPIGDMAYTPDVQILPGGNPIVLFEGSDMNMTSTYMRVTRSNDGGQTWSADMPADFSSQGQPCECCPPALLAKDSMVYVIYRNNDTGVRDIVMTISSDSGNTFPVFSQFDQTNWIINTCPTAGAESAFYADSIVTVWKSSNKLYFATANAIDGNEGSHQLLEPSLSGTILQRYPSIATSGDTVVYTWDDRRTNNQYDVFVAITAGGPQQITVAYRFNDTTGTAENGTQQNTSVAYHNGIIHLVYQDAVTGIVKYRRAVVGGVLGITEQEAIKSPVIFPVPAHESFTVQNVEGKFTVSIFSMNGQLVYQGNNLSSGHIISVENLSAGAYSVVITTESGAQTTLPLIRK